MDPSLTSAFKPQDYKPQDYSTVSPYLIVAGAEDTINFLVRVFGAVELRRFSRPSGEIEHAEVRVGDTVLMLADGGEGWPAMPANVHIYVADVDKTYRLALEAGAVCIQEPVRKEDEDKRGGGQRCWWDDVVDRDEGRVMPLG